MYTLYRFCVCGFIAACGMTPHHVYAQFGGVTNLLRGLQSNAVCQQLKEWVSSVPGAAGSRRPEDLAALLDDARATKALGKPYDRLTVNDLRDLQNSLRDCQREGNFTPAQAQTLQYLLNTSIHPTLSRQLNESRLQRARYAALMADLDTLQPTQDDARKLNTIEAELNTLSKTATPADKEAAAAKVSATRGRIAGHVQRERVSKALTEAQGREGLATLANLHDELGRAGLDAQHAQALQAEVVQRMSDIAAPLVQEERDHAAAIGDGLAGLERGVQFLAAFDARYQRAMRQVPDLDGIRRDVMQRRAAMLPALEPALIAEIRKSASEAQVNETLNRYLTATERQGVGRTIAGAAQERMAALRRKGENDRVFGAADDTTSAAPKAAAAASSPKTGRAFLADAAELRKYNEGRLIKAIYEGDTSGLPSDAAYVRSYLLQHARVFADPCRFFTLADIREFERIAMREQLPASQAQSGQMMAQSLKAMAEMMRNPGRMADAAAAEQKRQDAPELADKDLEVLIENYGACDSPVMKRYAKNVGSYLKTPSRSR